MVKKEYLQIESSLHKRIESLLVEKRYLQNKLLESQTELHECLTKRYNELTEMIMLRKELNKYKYPLKITNQKEKKTKVILFQKKASKRPKEIPY